MEIIKDEDRPPEEIWLDGEAIQDWFARVKERRDSETAGEESVPMDQNEATKGLRQRLGG
jgi:hypothetical protein